MIASATALLALLAGAQHPAGAGGHAPVRKEACTICHGKESKHLDLGVHAGAGFTCVSCHGGVAEAIEAQGAHAGDFRPLTDPRASVTSCGACHSDVERMHISGLRTDQLALYRTSRHGALLFETGDRDAATCVDCHGSHEIRHAADPLSSVHPRNQANTCGTCHADAALMERHGLPADQPELYTASVHGRAVADGLRASPSCTDCHGHHGALPPGIHEAEQVCGQCHPVVQEHYERSPHFALEPEVQCVTCHGNHLVQRASPAALAGEGPGSCSACHSAPDDPARAVAQGLHAELMRFEQRIEATAEATRAAGSRGLYLDQELTYLADAREVLVRARSLTHSVSRRDMDEQLQRGLGMLGQTEGRLADLARFDRDRRIFTAGFFVLTVALAIMLSMYAREIRGTGNGR